MEIPCRPAVTGLVPGISCHGGCEHRSLVGSQANWLSFRGIESTRYTCHFIGSFGGSMADRRGLNGSEKTTTWTALATASLGSPTVSPGAQCCAPKSLITIAESRSSPVMGTLIIGCPSRSAPFEQCRRPQGPRAIPADAQERRLPAVEDLRAMLRRLHRLWPPP
jgi:hypothetical protein